jgi:hypothetical protein
VETKRDVEAEVEMEGNIVVKVEVEWYMEVQMEAGMDC